MGRRKSRVVRIKITNCFDGETENVSKPHDNDEPVEEKKESHSQYLIPQLDIFSIPEILENVFKHMTNRDLRDCRLVRQVWNEEVCRNFRKIMIVRLFDRNLIYYERLLRSNMRLKLPLPFSNYRMSIRKLNDRNLIRILNSHPKPIVTSCSLIVSATATNSNYQKKLVSLLEKNAKSLQILIFNMFRGIYLGYMPMDNKLPTLQRLEKISIHTKARIIPPMAIPHESINFIVDVINASPSLKELEVTCDQEDVLIEIVQKGYLNALVSLLVEHLTNRQLEALTNTEIPNLTKLTLKCNETTIQDDTVRQTETLRKLVSNFAKTLMEMHISWIPSANNLNNGFPYCPRLKILTLYMYEGPLSAINVESLPVLEQFSLVEYAEFQGSEPIPHDRVQAFSIEDFSGLYVDDEFEMLINLVDRQFPKLTSLSIYMVVDDASVRTIVTSLPLLVKLRIRAGTTITEEAFTGIPFGFNIDEHLKAEKDLQDIRVFPSLANMQYHISNVDVVLVDVVELDISNFLTGPLITNTAIKHGLAMMPSLELLTMNWYSGLSENMIAESLGHLHCLKLNISDWHQMHPRSSIFNLKKILPQLHIPGYID